MSKPIVHANSSVKKFGGKPEDYLPIHQLMDSSKGTFADNRHRCLTHNSWFIAPGGPLESIFGVTITNSDGRSVSVRSIGEQHILEDFGGKFIPSVQDYLVNMQIQDWMNNGRGLPPSSHKSHTESKSEMNENDIEKTVDEVVKIIKSIKFPSNVID